MTGLRAHGRSACVAALATGAMVLLPTAPAPAAYPGANGAIAFTSNQDGGARHLFLTTATGLTDLTGATSSASETQPQFSPDGRQQVIPFQHGIGHQLVGQFQTGGGPVGHAHCNRAVQLHHGRRCELRQPFV